MSSTLARYYRLCTVALGGKAHIVSGLPPEKLPILFTKKEIELYFRPLDGAYIARELVVGGSDSAADCDEVVIFG